MEERSPASKRAPVGSTRCCSDSYRPWVGFEQLKAEEAEWKRKVDNGEVIWTWSGWVYRDARFGIGNEAGSKPRAGQNEELGTSRIKKDLTWAQVAAGALR